MTNPERREKIKRMLENFREVEWIMTNDQKDTDEHIDNRLNNALSAIEALWLKEEQYKQALERIRALAIYSHPAFKIADEALEGNIGEDLMGQRKDNKEIK